MTTNDVSNDPINHDDLKRLYRTVAKKCPARMQPADIEDIVSEMLLDATKASKKTGIPITPLAFTNASRKRFYARAAGRVDALRDYTEQYAGPFAETVGAGAAQLDVDEVALRFDMIAKIEIDDLIASLTDEIAAAIALHLQQDLTLADSAKHMGVSTSTAQHRVERGKEALATAINAANAA